jgi:hypothetical protein
MDVFVVRWIETAAILLIPRLKFKGQRAACPRAAISVAISVAIRSCTASDRR